MLHDAAVKAPLRLIAATLRLHDLPLAPPPWAPATQHSSNGNAGCGAGDHAYGRSYVPDLAGYTTSDARGGRLWLQLCRYAV